MPVVFEEAFEPWLQTRFLTIFSMISTWWPIGQSPRPLDGTNQNSYRHNDARRQVRSQANLNYQHVAIVSHAVFCIVTRSAPKLVRLTQISRLSV